MAAPYKPGASPGPGGRDITCLAGVPAAWRRPQAALLGDAARRARAEILAAERDGLRSGMTVDEAAGVIFALASPGVYLLLTAGSGWGPGQWLDGVTATVARAVLR